LARDFQRNEAARTRAAARLAELTAARDSHACHPCEVRKVHQRTLRRRDELERDRAAADDRLQRQIRREQQRIDHLIGGIAGVLHAFGYLDRGNLTAKAAMLANIFDPNGLILAEAIDRGWLDDLEADDLAEVCSWFAFDRDSRFANHFLLSSRLIALRRELEELQEEVFSWERRHELVISTGFNRLFFGAMRAWCRGADLADIVEGIELSEGDLVTAFNKTVDLMRQLRDMLLETTPGHPVRHSLDWSIKLAQRDIVAHSFQLGFLGDEPAGTTPETEPEDDEAETSGSLGQGADA
jgi:ATP-dependent RNA helicase HelY